MTAPAFRPCLLIPIYNHGDAIRGAVLRLAAHGLPIFIVDDGSDSATRTELARVAADFPQVRLWRLPQNGGKGAAVMHGMREAFAAGMTHALQIDADGQHDAGDAPLFLARGRANPGAVICGRPIYDDSVPKARLYGRYLTHVWVWLETLSFAIGDSMCGFRLYPLAPACELIDRVRIPRRMDFDIEIIVRLAWQGLPVENLPTRVTYPDGGLSHFRMVRDNWRISTTHTRLVLGMLARLPRLLGRRLAGGHPSPPSSGRGTGERYAVSHWSRLGERGSLLGLRITAACYRLLGRRATRLLLYPVVAYFFLTAGDARRASRSYLRRVQARAGGAGPAPGWRDSFRHMLAFARSGVDKFAAWTGGLDHREVAFAQRADFDRLLASGKGAVIIGSHLGNLEMARALAASRHAGADNRLATVNAVVYTDHARRFNTLLARANADFQFNLIQVTSLGPDTAIHLKEKVDRGELLVIVGDRTPPSENGRISRVEFLGAPAAFAQGPFILASLLEAPVYLLFCLEEGGGYRIHLEHFAERIELPRREREARLRECVQRYARRLEAYCLQAPEQWFNFFDFWRDSAGMPRHGSQSSRP